MRVFAKLFVSAICVVGMTSCLKNNDSFGISQGGWYILQRNDLEGGDTIPKFAPYIWFSTNENMVEATMTGTSYGAVSGKINSYVWVSNVPDYNYRPEIEEQTFVFRATNAGGDVTGYSVSMGADPEKAIGDFNAEFSYASNNGLTVKWGEVKNAGLFELVCRLSDDPNSVRSVKTVTTDRQGEILFSNSDALTAGLTNGKRYSFELFAYAIENNIITIKLENRSGQNQFNVDSWGTDNPAEQSLE